MSRLKAIATRLGSRVDGATTVEYALALGLLGLSCLAASRTLARVIEDLMTLMSEQLR